ncbi:hypothetical protein NAS141_00205 [Sulfitobacter sp. NAS-14.1]|nr:hypothetical protein NAS141_00205 [Sulfitobacter sp. NAS-14.1]
MGADSVADAAAAVPMKNLLLIFT